MFAQKPWRVFLALILCGLFAAEGRALIVVGDNRPLTQLSSNPNFPPGSGNLANLPTRSSYWEGPGFGGGNYHFEYAGDTAQFQAALDAFAAIQAPRLELFVYDGATTSPHSQRPVKWEFEVWDREAFFRVNHPDKNLFMSDSPWFRQPLPPPRLSVFLGGDKPIDWSAVRVPGNVTVLDRRVATSPWASMDFGVVHAVVRDMATSRPLAGVTLEVGSYDVNRQFQSLAANTTNGAGEVVIDNLPTGAYTLRLSREGYATREVGSYRNFGHTLGVFDPVGLAPAAALKGRVTDPAGRPIAGARIRVAGLVGPDGKGYLQNLYNEQTTATTDAGGRFTLAPLPRGRTSLSVNKPGYHYFSIESHEIPGEGVKIVMNAAGQVQGKVLDTNNKTPTRAFMVDIAPRGGSKVGSWSGSMMVQPGGRFEFKNVPPGEYILTAHPNPMQEGEAAPARPVTVEGGKTVEVEISL